VTKPHALSSQAIKALAAIILTAVVGIIILSAWALALRSGVLGNDVNEFTSGTADEALSILGNVASAAVGGLVGWLTRDIVARTVVEQPAEEDEGA
jgi:hypothetical protein